MHAREGIFLKIRTCPFISFPAYCLADILSLELLLLVIAKFAAGLLAYMSRTSKSGCADCTPANSAMEAALRRFARRPAAREREKKRMVWGVYRLGMVEDGSGDRAWKESCIQ
jgi:hypothetical protein